MEEIVCQRCGSINDYHTTQSGPHIKAVCNGCNRYIKFVPKSQARPGGNNEPAHAVNPKVTHDEFRKPLTYEFIELLGLEFDDDNLYINPAMRLCYDGRTWRVEFKEDGNWSWYSSVDTEGQFMILISLLAPDLIKKEQAA